MLKPEQIEKYRRRLQELARRHDGELASLREETHGVGGESGGNLSNAPIHPADLGTAYHEEEVNLLLLENQENLLAECDAALADRRGQLRPVRALLSGDPRGAARRFR